MEQRHARRLLRGAVVLLVLIMLIRLIYRNKAYYQRYLAALIYDKRGAQGYETLVPRKVASPYSTVKSGVSRRARGQALPSREAFHGTDMSKCNDILDQDGDIVQREMESRGHDETRSCWHISDDRLIQGSRAVESMDIREVQVDEESDRSGGQGLQEAILVEPSVGEVLPEQRAELPDVGVPRQDTASDTSGNVRDDARRVRRRPPGRRGGRYHRPIGGPAERRQTVRSITSPPREAALLKCRREGMSWVIGVELESESEQDGFSSEKEEFMRITSYEEFTSVLGSETCWRTSVGSDPMFLFRLRGDSEGICEVTVRVGWRYLLVVPAGAEVRSEARVNQVWVDVDGGEGYVFALREGEHITVNYAGKERVIAPARLSIDFAGEAIPGVASPDRVFRAVRGMTVSRGGAAAPVVQIVLRLEGYRPGGKVWTRSLPVEGKAVVMSSELQEEMREIGAGRFTARCYDAEGRLLGSEDFSLVAGLREVQRTRLEDSLVRIRFVLDEGYRVQSETLELRPEHDEWHWSFLVAPSQRAPRLEDWDLLYWRVTAPNGSAVTVGVNLERVFWTVDHQHDQAPPAEMWGSEPVLLRRSDFEATSAKALWLWIPPSERGQSEIVIRRQDRAETDISRPYRLDSNVPQSIALRNLGHLVPERPGKYELVLRLKGSSIVLGYWQVCYRCQLCVFESLELALMLQHIHVQHGRQYFSEVNPLELWEREGKELPERVYQCLYCGKGFAEGGYENANTAIGEHQRKDCPEARRRFPDGPVVESIRVLERDQRAKMIRALVGRRWRCLLCDALVSEGEQRVHLQEHQSELVLLS